MRKRQICGIVAAIACTIIGLLTVFALPGLIREVILEGVLLDPDTFDLWGQNPGKSGVVTFRNFTFYNFSNPRQFLYHNQKPKFTQITNFLYQQRSNFTNHKFSDDKNVVNFDFWLFFTQLNGGNDPNTEVNVINLAPLGFWNQLGEAPLPLLAIQGFGGLFVEMNATIKTQAIGQGVQSQFLKDYKSMKQTCSILNIQQQTCNWLWNDLLYGLNNNNNYLPWIKMSYNNDKDSQILLSQYFGLKNQQITNLKNIISMWSQSLQNILNNWYCGDQCTSYQFTLLQLGSGGITGNPPSGDAVDSICDSGNVTCQGTPELYSFYKYTFPKIINDSSYYGLVFQRQTMASLFRPYNGTLLNVGNLTQLFDLGQKFDKDRKNVQLLQKLIAVTHVLGDRKQKKAIIVWQYVKYFVSQFVLKNKQGGTKKIVGIAGVASQALYQSMTQFSDWILPQIIGLLLAQKIGNCEQFLYKILPSLSSKLVSQLCTDVNEANYREYYDLVKICEQQPSQQQYKNGLNSYIKSQLCDEQDQSLGRMLKQSHQFIASRYNCILNPKKSRCNSYELAIKQFFNSSITLFPIQSSIRQYNSSYTGHQWNKQLQVWQYKYFLNQVYNNPNIDPQSFDQWKKVVSFLSFDGLFSVSVIQDMLLTPQSSFQQRFKWKNKTLLQNYLRFLTIQVGFGGFIQKRSVKQLLFGYQDEFLRGLRDQDPMLGGDPSIQITVMLNEPNMTLQQAKYKPQSMYTGYSDYQLTRVYKQNYNKNYITYNHTYYNGYQILTQFVSPYLKNERLYGTDAIQNKPMCETSQNQYIYIDTLYRVGQLSFDSKISKFGFQLNSKNTLASSDDYPPNQNFNQKISGFMNLSFLGLPLFPSKNHFLGTDPKWAQMIEMVDLNGHPQRASKYDQTQLVIQPNTGASFTATIYLQTNFYHQPDILFTHKQSIMLPVFTLYRSGNMTSQIADDLLGDLKTALVAPRKLLIISIVGLLFSLMGIVSCHRSQKLLKKQSLLQRSANEFGQQQIQNEFGQQNNNDG